MSLNIYVHTYIMPSKALESLSLYYSYAISEGSETFILYMGNHGPTKHVISTWRPELFMCH